MMDFRNLISIIVPIYRVEKYLDACIRSLVEQTYKNIEIILVDDGSPDGCPAICDAWAEKDTRIRVIHKQNGGVSDARNSGIEIAAGWWLLFIDSDDAVPANFVEQLVSASAGNDRLVVSDKIKFSDNLPRVSNTVPAFHHLGKAISAKRGGLYCWGALYCHDLVRSIHLHFDTALCNLEDVVWNGIYLRYISEVVQVDVPYFYRMNPTLITSRCSDYNWQIASWIAARKSIMNWFANKPLTPTQKKEVQAMFRHCQNNIYAECVAGKVSYAALHALETNPSAQFCEALVSSPERFMRNYLPKFYYTLYALMLRIKNILRK